METTVLLITEDANGKATTLGSGFQVGPGIIATNYHVIREASRAYASFHEGSPKFEVLGTLAIDDQNDVALLRLGRVVRQDDPYDEVVVAAMALPLATESSEVGETVYVIGNPEGLEGTFSQGIISALRGTEYIQITAPISPGSSGGPVINQYGEALGIATWFNREGQNLNFAIPVAKLRPLMRNLSTVTPLRPRTRLRFDGMYRAFFKGEAGIEYVNYLRFYEDGRVFEVGTTPSVSLDEVFAWLPSSDNAALYSGRFALSGSNIQFSLAPRIIDTRKLDASIDFEGVIGHETIRLSSFNHWSGVKEEREFRFIKTGK
ncbi:MAG: trypsin-like peptidase domain-containing protein [Pyrinomonadaceae bacterium]